jgi:hypothetical protein
MTLDAKIGIIGDGNVGSALHQGLQRAGYQVDSVGKEPPRVKQLAQGADIIFLAVPFSERQNALREMGDVSGKTIVDVTNAMGDDMLLAIDPNKQSGAEQLKEWAGGATVVKAFNTLFAQHMDKGTLHGERLTVLAASDDEGAKKRVIELAKAIGFDAIDAGPLENARWLETLGMLNIKLGYGVGHGPAIGFKLVHEATGQKKEGEKKRVSS